MHLLARRYEPWPLAGGQPSHCDALIVTQSCTSSVRRGFVMITGEYFDPPFYNRQVYSVRTFWRWYISMLYFQTFEAKRVLGSMYDHEKLGVILVSGAGGRNFYTVRSLQTRKYVHWLTMLGVEVESGNVA